LFLPKKNFKNILGISITPFSTLKYHLINSKNKKSNQIKKLYKN
jgi:hypothetical protein